MREIDLDEAAETLSFSPVASGPRQPVVFGRLAGQFEIPDDFDAPLPDDLLDLFEGKP